MKKLMALLLCAFMLLTATSVMPVLADEEGTEAVNLITNGDFEADTAGEDSVAAGAANVTQITGWTQMYEGNKFVLVAREGGSNWVKGFNDSNGAYDGTNLPEAGISQTVTIDTEADWYTDYKNYKYVLTYDAHKAGSVWRGSVIVTVTGANGRVETTDVTPPAADYTPNAYNADVTVDLSNAVEKIGRSAVASIKLDLTAAHTYEYQTYDNIRITPVYSPVVEAESFIPDGSFEELATAEISPWGFAGGASSESNLVSDEYAFDESYYVAIDAGQRVEQEIGGDMVKAGNAYLLEFYYMSVEATAFLTVETSVGYLKLGEPTLPATGTTWDDAVWKKYQFMIVMRECDSAGIVVRLRNSAAATNSVFYDYVTLTLVPGYDTENMLANADFEYGDETYLPNWIQNGSLPMVRGAGNVYTGQYCAQSTGSYGALQQNVYLDPAYENSELELSFYFNYSSGGGAMPSILVRGYREDGSFTGYSYTACVDMNSNGILSAEDGDRGCTEDNQAYVDGLHWIVGTEKSNTYYGTIDLEKALSRDTDPRPVKRILIQLGTANLGGTYDSVKLSPKTNKISFENHDLTIPESVSEIKNGQLTMKARYIGEAENAKAYVAVYETQQDGSYTLTAVNVLSLGTDETEKSMSLAELNITENTVVKGFIWDGTQSPVLLKTLE